MKKQSLIILSGLLIITSSLFAQKKDHPLIGHLDGAKLWIQNINNIHEYNVITGSVKNDSLISSIKIVGKTTLTAYQYKGDNSTFGIIHNYTNFLKDKGYEILYSCKSGECGGDISKFYIKSNNIETTDDNNVHVFGSRYFKNYLSAKKQENGKTVYVCIFITQGWWDFPVYRIDVIEEKEKNSMILNDNKEQEKNIQKTDNSPQISEKLTNEIEPNNKKSNSFTIQVGMGQYSFYDPQLYGEDVVYESNGVFTGTLSGFKDLSGPYVKTAYFFNDNLGIAVDIAFHSIKHSNYIDYGTTVSSEHYKISADLNFQRIGLTGRFIGDEYPIKLLFSSGIGRGSFEAYYQIKTANNVVNTQIDYNGKIDFPMIYFQIELVIPVFKGLFIFSEYEYTVGWGGNFSLIHDNGTEYNEIKYKWPMYGGNCLRVGLGYEL